MRDVVRQKSPLVNITLRIPQVGTMLLSYYSVSSCYLTNIPKHSGLKGQLFAELMMLWVRI